MNIILTVVRYFVNNEPTVQYRISLLLIKMTAVEYRTAVIFYLLALFTTDTAGEKRKFHNMTLSRLKFRSSAMTFQSSFLPLPPEFRPLL